VHKRFDAPNLLKLTWLQHSNIKNFISFPKSPGSSKSEFGVKSYAQNTRSILFWARGLVHHLRKLQQLPLTASTRGGPTHRSCVSCSEAPIATSNGLVHVEVRCTGLVHHKKVRSAIESCNKGFLTASFSCGSIYTIPPAIWRCGSPSNIPSEVMCISIAPNT
jgi:hypothetical protein